MKNEQTIEKSNERSHRRVGVAAVALLLVPLLTQAAPELRVVSPTEAAVLVEGEPVVVQFETGGYLFVDHAGNNELYPANPEAGHVHLWIDPPDGSREHAAARKLLGAGPVDLGVLEPGEHEIVIELAANEHSPLAAPVIERRSFSVGDSGRAGESDSSASSSGASGAFLIAALLASLLLYRFRDKIKAKFFQSKDVDSS